MINYILQGANIIAGILILLLGYNIKFKNRVELIKNYNPDSLKDEESYSNCLGIIKMIIGLTFILLGVVGFIVVNNIIISIILDVLLIIIFIALLLWSYKRYKL